MVDPSIYGGLGAALGLSWSALWIRIYRYRRLTARVIGDPTRRRAAITRLREAQVKMRIRAATGWEAGGLLAGGAGGRLGARVAGIWFDQVVERERGEIEICLADLLCAEDRPEEAEVEIKDPKPNKVSRERRQARARLRREVEARLALGRGEGERALEALSGLEGPRLPFLRARALAMLGRSPEEVWRIVTSQPRAELADFIARHPAEPAADLARQVLGDVAAYR